MSNVTNGGNYRNSFDRADSYYAASIAPAQEDFGKVTVGEIMLKRKKSD